VLSNSKAVGALFDNSDLPYCGSDKGMPNDWSFNWESIATRERAVPETCCVESLLVVYLFLLAISQ
jgi:hypothetical protein